MGVMAKSNPVQCSSRRDSVCHARRTLVLAKEGFGDSNHTFRFVLPDFGITHPGFGITQPDCGITRPDDGIARQDIGIARSDAGIAHPNTGSTRPDAYFYRQCLCLAGRKTGGASWNFSVAELNNIERR